MKIFLMMSLLFVLGACAYKPEDPGLCRLNCSSAIISGNDAPLSIALKTNVSSLTCPVAAAGSAVSDPFFVQFLVGESFGDDDTQKGVRPVPNISIEPIVNGLRSDLPEHNPNVEINGNIFTPARYKGIITLKDNWCSDSCGVVTLEIAAACPPPGSSSDVSIQLHSGALYSDQAIFPTTTEAAP